VNYRGAGAAIVVYDISSAESFNKVQYWVNVYHLPPDELREHSVTSTYP
jgi:hypothetical protein